MIRILLVLFISCPVYAQIEPGIYFVTAPGKKTFCEQKIRGYFARGTYCVSKKPIVGIEEFEYITEILYDAGARVNYINVGLSSAGVGILNKVYESMPGSQLAIVVEEKVLGRFMIEEKIVVRYMNIGRDLDLARLKIVRSVLQKHSVKKD